MPVTTLMHLLNCFNNFQQKVKVLKMQNSLVDVNFSQAGKDVMTSYYMSRHSIDLVTNIFTLCVSPHLDRGVGWGLDGGGGGIWGTLPP